jgi:hypothetical protein
MSTIVLVVVVAAWAAVLVPPLMRGRTDNRPGSSVVDFRRQLSTLQRSAPARGMAPMRMGQPLAPSPTRALRQPGEHTRSLHRHPYHTPARGISRSHLVRQRRQNVLMALSLTTLGSAFIAFTTKSDLFIYIFVLAAISLIGYCYKLSQIRRYRAPQAYRRDWIRAA